MIDKKELAESTIKSCDIIVEKYHELDPKYCIGALASHIHILGEILKGTWDETKPTYNCCEKCWAFVNNKCNLDMPMCEKSICKYYKINCCHKCIHYEGGNANRICPCFGQIKEGEDCINFNKKIERECSTCRYCRNLDVNNDGYCYRRSRYVHANFNCENWRIRRYLPIVNCTDCKYCYTTPIFHNLRCRLDGKCSYSKQCENFIKGE